MIPPNELRTSKEYIEETIFNSLWRVCLKKSSLKDEAAHLTRLMLETRELLIKQPMYPHIQTKEKYDLLLASGMFFEFHPELSGNWEVDKEMIHDK